MSISTTESDFPGFFSLAPVFFIEEDDYSASIGQFSTSHPFLICIILTHPSLSRKSTHIRFFAFICSGFLKVLYFTQRVCGNTKERREKKRVRRFDRKEKNQNDLLVAAAFWLCSDTTTCWGLITGLIMLKNPNQGELKWNSSIKITTMSAAAHSGLLSRLFTH